MMLSLLPRFLASRGEEAPPADVPPRLAPGQIFELGRARVVDAAHPAATSMPALRAFLKTLQGPTICFFPPIFFRKAHLIAHAARAGHELLPHSLLACAVPDHVDVPPHRLLSDDELREVCAQEGFAPQQLPKIAADDPPVAWLGGRPGQVVEVQRYSMTAGGAIAWRLIVPSQYQAEEEDEAP
jgi:DNA-directed RNA polymerase subunit H